MSKGVKIWLIIAASLILLGIIGFGGIMTMLKWDFTRLSTSKYETNDYDIGESYSNISITTDTADIIFVPTEGSDCSVECYEQERVKHSVTVKDDTLVIEAVDTRKWYDHIGVNFGAPKITVYIPQGEYGSLSVESSTGDIEVPKELSFKSIDVSENTGTVTNYASATESIKIKTTTGGIFIEGVSSESLDLSVSTGRVTVADVNLTGDIAVKVSTGKTKLSDITCKNVFTSGSTGDILLHNVIAKGCFSIKRTTGDVKLEDCDAANILIETDTGDVVGTLLTEKIFIVRTDTGRISVPDSVTGGRCGITTDTGDISINVP